MRSDHTSRVALRERLRFKGASFIAIYRIYLEKRKYRRGTLIFIVIANAVTLAIILWNALR